VARFGLPRGLALDSSGNIYVADSSNDIIRKLTPSGADWMVTTLAGSPGQTGAADGVGSNARFNAPTGVAVDNGGNVYVVDSGEYRVSKGSAAPAALQFSTSSGGLTVSNGIFQMRLSGPSSGSVILDSSTNFTSWTPIQTNSLSSGTVVFSVPINQGPFSFFRARLAP
jgi:secreted PhoX family phosphatase